MKKKACDQFKGASVDSNSNHSFRKTHLKNDSEIGRQGGSIFLKDNSIEFSQQGPYDAPSSTSSYFEIKLPIGGEVSGNDSNSSRRSLSFGHKDSPGKRPSFQAGSECRPISKNHFSDCWEDNRSQQTANIMTLDNVGPESFCKNTSTKLEKPQKPDHDEPNEPKKCQIRFSR